MKRTRNPPTEVLQRLLVNPTFVITEIANVTFVMWMTTMMTTTCTTGGRMLQAATCRRRQHPVIAPPWELYHYPPYRR